MAKNFLTAEWRKLAMANYAIDENILHKYLPKGTEVDLWNGICYVSLVGFMFQNTRVMGMAIPFHKNFEEVNLRFYVRYNHLGEWRRGVVFVKEIVPKAALTFVANAVYNENYETMPMSHLWINEDNKLVVSYGWKKDKWNSFKVTTSQESVPIIDGSEEEFITEHYWGYTKISNDVTAEYEVEHPKWHVYKTVGHSIDVDFGKIYGTDFDFLKLEEPKSVFLAEGSVISVKHGRKI